MSHNQKWLLFFYAAPAKPGNLRMRVWRRLNKLGAISLKGSVYLLPFSEDHLEALHWLTGEVAGLGGEAAFVQAGRIETVDDGEIAALFNSQREHEYAPVEGELEALEVRLSSLEQQPDSEGLGRLSVSFRKVLKGFRSIEATDFFHSPRGAAVKARLEGLAERLGKVTGPPPGARAGAIAPQRKEDYQNRIWVTRAHPFVDRMASAWLIRHAIDPQARFEFLEKDRTRAEVPEGVSFDLPGGDFSHARDQCTFEVLLAAFNLRDKALRQIGEVVHELDLKDGRFHHPQTGGVESILLGIRKTAGDDREALEEGIKVFARLYAALSK